MINSKKDFPVSACLIVQNEEKYLDKTLQNLYHNVAEIVIVDGGSTDRTLQICEKYNCKIFNRKFDFDFSAQRNFGQQQCTKDWILWCDADEYFSEDFYLILPTLLLNSDKKIAVFKIWRKSIFDGELKGEDYQPRLINRRYAHWNGKIHEGIIFNDSEHIEMKLPKEYYMVHEHTMKRQLFNNKLYYNINNGIMIRPYDNEGCESQNEKWINIKTERDG